MTTTSVGRWPTDQDGVRDGSATALDEAAVSRSALDCYRNAARAGCPQEAAAWMRAGAWFERLGARVDPDGAATGRKPANDRRLFPRVKASGGVLLTLGNTIHLARLENISRGGACVSLPPSLDAAPGRMLEVTAPPHATRLPARVMAVGEGRMHLAFATPIGIPDR
ncbi:MAG: PilZ domain [Pseudomonadota bacterium]|jgi:hypothetical protein